MQKKLCAIKITQIQSYAIKGVAFNLKGNDSLDLLHRLSTNKVVGAKINTLQGNSFVNSKGRLVARFFQRVTDNNSVSLFFEREKLHIVRDWIEAHIFIEDIVIDEAANIDLQILVGPDSILANLAKKNPKSMLKIFDVAPLKATAFLFLDSESNKIKYTAFSDDEFETLRIAGMWPKTPNEICDAYNPLELGLKSHISFQKGCYIGQEVIAKLENLGKLSRYMRGITVSQSEWEAFKPNQEVHKNTKVIGKITSIAPLYLPCGPQALSVIKGKA